MVLSDGVEVVCGTGRDSMRMFECLAMVTGGAKEWLYAEREKELV